MTRLIDSGQLLAQSGALDRLASLDREWQHLRALAKKARRSARIIGVRGRKRLLEKTGELPVYLHGDADEDVWLGEERRQSRTGWGH